MNQNQDLRNKIYIAILGKRPSEISGIVKKVISENLDSVLPPLPPVTVRRDPNEPNRVICEFALRPLLLKDEEHESIY